MIRIPMAVRAGLLAMLFIISNGQATAVASPTGPVEMRPPRTRRKEPKTPRASTKSQKPASKPTPQGLSDPVQSTHYVFIGKPVQYRPLDCDIFESPTAPHRRPPRRLSDATDFPERLQVLIEVVEAVQNPAHVSRTKPRLLSPSKARNPVITVAFALGAGAFRAPDVTVGRGAYDRAYCVRLNRLLGSKLVVLHAYPIYIDRGNSSPDRWRAPWDSLGTDPGKANAGFETLAEAQTYAKARVQARH